MKSSISTDSAPKADHILSQAIRSGNTIYVSGQAHVTPEGVLVEGTVGEKLTQIMQNIVQILGAVGANLDDVVKVTIYVTEMSQMPELNDVYPVYFSKPLPAREAVCVKELPLGATIEISVIAVK